MFPPDLLHLAPGPSIKPSPSCVTSSVPFLESPKFVPRRKESVHTLPLPSLHSHPLLRANSDNTVIGSDPLILPAKAATNPGQVLTPFSWSARPVCVSTDVERLCRASAGPPSGSGAPAAPGTEPGPRPEAEEARAIRRSGTGSPEAGRGKA